MSSRLPLQTCFRTLLADVREGGSRNPRLYRHRGVNPAPESPEIPSLTGFRATVSNPVAMGIATRSSGMDPGIFLNVPAPGCSLVAAVTGTSCFLLFGSCPGAVGDRSGCNLFLFLLPKDRHSAGLAADSLGCPVIIVLCFSNENSPRNSSLDRIQLTRHLSVSGRFPFQ